MAKPGRSENPGSAGSQRQTVNAASAVDNKGGFWFSTYQGSLNAERFVQLLRKMIAPCT